MSKQQPISKDDMLQAYLTALEQDQITDELLGYCTLIKDLVGAKLQYKNADDRKIVDSFVTQKILEKWRKFNPEQSDNAFSFMYILCRNAWFEGFNKYVSHRGATAIISLDALFADQQD